MKNNIDPFVELAVWSHLDKKTDLEMILLKGHLLLEIVLDTALCRINIKDCENFSFYKKVDLLEKYHSDPDERGSFVFSSLKKINRLRNKLAHEVHFDIANGELDTWALEITENLEGEKFSKYTSRTKVVHAFSTLSGNILKLYDP